MLDQLCCRDWPIVVSGFMFHASSLILYYLAQIATDLLGLEVECLKFQYRLASWSNFVLLPSVHDVYDCILIPIAPFLKLYDRLKPRHLQIFLIGRFLNAYDSYRQIKQSSLRFEILLTYLFIEHSLVTFGLLDQLLDPFLLELNLLHQKCLLSRALIAFQSHFILYLTQFSLTALILFD